MRVGIVRRRLYATFLYRSGYPDQCDTTIFLGKLGALVSLNFCLEPRNWRTYENTPGTGTFCALGHENRLNRAAIESQAIDFKGFASAFILPKAASDRSKDVIQSNRTLLKDESMMGLGQKVAYSDN